MKAREGGFLSVPHRLLPCRQSLDARYWLLSVDYLVRSLLSSGMGETHCDPAYRKHRGYQPENFIASIDRTIAILRRIVG